MRHPTATSLTVCALLLSAVSFLSINADAQSSRPFVEPDFDVPNQVETPDFRLRTLTVNDVVKDYDAVMSSAEHLKTIWPGSGWPEGLTLEQNLIDLGWHQKEFQRRTSFAYTVVTLDERKVIGCVYIDPTRKRGYDAEVYLWAREAAIGSPSDAQLFKVVHDWLKAEWPFAKVAYPGRDINWKAWDEIPEEKR